MAQVKTRNVSVASVVRDPAFRKGVADYTRGLAPDWDQYGLDTNKAWAYERGRLAAAWAASAGRDLPEKCSPCFALVMATYSARVWP